MTVDSAAEVADLVASGKADVGVCDLPVAGPLLSSVLGCQEDVAHLPDDRWIEPDDEPPVTLRSPPIALREAEMVLGPPGETRRPEPARYGQARW